MSFHYSRAVGRKKTKTNKQTNKKNLRGYLSPIHLARSGGVLPRDFRCSEVLSGAF